MPIYEYRCQLCNHELEKLQRMSDPSLRNCPSCGEPGLRRLISAAGFRLKGAGWYETDFKKDNRKNLVESGDAKNGSSSEKAPASDAAGKTPETKASANKSDGKSADAT
jgi:putative FmdB family regulatory protein